SGKLDRRALPPPRGAALEEAGHERGAPRSDLECALERIWAEVLRVRAVDPGKDFFALGGHSLMAVQVVSRVRSVLGVELPVRTLFQAPTVTDLAREIERLRAEGASASSATIPSVSRELYRAPSFEFPASLEQRRLWFLEQWEPETA